MKMAPRPLPSQTLTLPVLPAELRGFLGERARTFSLASHFLPRAQREAVVILYAYCRVVDDLVDEPPAVLAPEQVRSELQSWRAWLATEGGAPEPGEPRGLAPALAAVIRHYGVPRGYLLALLDGVESDLSTVVMPDLPALRRYCMRVAGAVGLAMCSILGAGEPEALVAAAQLGVAMQLTNILRDLGADLRRGRVYLPADELAASGYTPADLLALGAQPVLPDDRLRPLLARQIERARAYYARGLAGVGLLPPASRRAVLIAGLVYRAILAQIEKMGYDVLRRRAVVPRATKARLVLAAMRASPPAAGNAELSLGEVLSWLG